MDRTRARRDRRRPTPSGAAWEVLYVDSLTGVQFADPERSGFMTGLFFSGTLGGVTLGALAVGSLFDAIGVGWGLTV